MSKQTPFTADGTQYEGYPCVNNNRYRVVIHKLDSGAMWLSIKRHDKKPIRNWRDLLWIKNELAGPERWGFEVFPPMSRLIDTSNQYHLFITPEGETMPEFGFSDEGKPQVVDGDGSTGPGRSRQQPIPPWYPEPVDPSEL